MNVFGDAHEISQHYAPQIDRLQRLLLFHGLACGSPQSLGLLLSALEENKALRLDLAALANSLLQGSSPGSRPVLAEDDLATALALASGGPSLTAGFGSSSELFHALPLLRMFLVGVRAQAGVEPVPTPSAGDPSSLSLPEELPDAAPALPHAAPVLSPDRLPPRLVFSALPAPHEPFVTAFPDLLPDLDPGPQSPSPMPPALLTPADQSSPAVFASTDPLVHTPPGRSFIAPAVPASSPLHPISGPANPPAPPAPVPSAAPSSNSVTHAGAASAPPRLAYHPLRRSPASLHTPVLRNLGFRLTAHTAHVRHLASSAVVRARSGLSSLRQHSPANLPQAAALAGLALLLALSALALRLETSHPRALQSLLPHVQASVTPTSPASTPPQAAPSPRSLPAATTTTPVPALELAAKPAQTPMPATPTAPHPATQTAAHPATHPAADLHFARLAMPSRDQPRPAASPALLSTASSQAPLLVSDVAMRQRLVSSRKPVYPPSALLTHQAGSVLLNALIARDGTVKRVDVVRGDPAFINSAVAAVTWWRYQPFLVRGQPTPVRTEIHLTFPAQ